MVERADRGQRQHVRLDVGQILAALIFEDVISEPVGRVELGPADPVQGGEILLGGLALGRKMGVAERSRRAGRHSGNRRGTGR